MKYGKEIKIGFTVIAAVAFVIWGVFFLKGRNILTASKTYYAIYSNVQGLVVASPVLVNGVKVGQVASIEIDPVNTNRIYVGFDIDNSKLRLPKDSRANFGSADLMNKAIILEMGNSKEYFNVGDTITSETQLTLQESISKEIIPLKEKTKELIGSIDSMVDILSGVMGRNSGELDESFKSVRRAILKFENTAHNLDELIANEKVRISSITAKVDNIAGTIVSNTPKINNIISNVGKMSDSLAKADIAGTINRARNSLDELSKVMAKVNNGEGTLGALLKNDSLYNELVSTNKEMQRLLENVKEYPNRYVHFSIFGRKDKGIKLDATDERKLKKVLEKEPDPGKAK